MKPFSIYIIIIKHSDGLVGEGVLLVWTSCVLKAREVVRARSCYSESSYCKEVIEEGE